MAGHQVQGKEKKEVTSNLLRLAIDLGDLKFYQNLVKEDVNIGSRNLDCGGVTPVLYALRFKQLEIAEDLILRGASVAEADRSHSRGWTPFHSAARWGHDRILRVLFRKAPQELVRWCLPFHPIHLAIANGHTECVELIIDHARKSTSKPSTLLVSSD